MSCPFHEKWEAGVWNKGTLRILFWVLLRSYIEIILKAVISRVFPYPDVGVIFENCVLSSGHKLADAEPAGPFDSCSETKN